jgi:hypothetical protein
MGAATGYGVAPIAFFNPLRRVACYPHQETIPND